MIQHEEAEEDGDPRQMSVGDRGGTHRLQPITVSSWKLAQVNLQLWVDASIPCKCNWRFEVNATAHGGASGFIKLDFA